MKNTDIQVLQRRKDVAKHYLQGFSRPYLQRYYIDKYGLTTKSLEHDITVIREELPVSTDFQEVFETQLRALQNLQDDALARGDEATVLNTSTRITNLLKLVNPNKAASNVQINNTVNNLPQLSVEEIRKLLGRGDEPKTIDITE
jgi:hypothetical protein